MDQAARCLDLWLAEEGRSLPPRLRARAAALMARYFLHEEDASDALMLSFLRHYAGFGEVDMDDPQSVRMELKAVLDRSAPRAAPEIGLRGRIALALLSGALLTALAFGGWQVTHRTITPQQQAELRKTVDRIVAAEGVSHMAVWSQAKKDFGVSRYQDILWIDYDDAQAALAQRLAARR